MITNNTLFVTLLSRIYSETKFRIQGVVTTAYACVSHIEQNKGERQGVIAPAELKEAMLFRLYLHAAIR